VVEEGPKLLTPSDVKSLARRYGIRPSQALGQNFVVDPNTIRRVVRLAEVAASDRVVEVGAGLGTLTLGLSAAASDVIAIELDRRLIPALREVLADRSNVRLVEGDAMSVDYPGLLGSNPHRFISNLPYNIATPLIATLLDQAPSISDFVVMVQREVGERLAARPGSKSYGGITVLVAYHCRATILGKVPPTVFWPAPKVESLLIRLERRAPEVKVESAELMPVVRAAFGQRRKTVRNALVAGLGQSAERVEEALRRAGVAPGARAESLSLEEFALIVEALR
jgi:16S rRNA (adenine1518-N6/adenine1519-N6)-dimethyltransferase